MDELILYSCDAWHTKSCRELQGVFPCREWLDNYLEGMHEARELSDDDMDMLRESHQTQGRETNLVFEKESLDPHFRGYAV